MNCGQNHNKYNIGYDYFCANFKTILWLKHKIWYIIIIVLFSM